MQFWSAWAFLIAAVIAAIVVASIGLARTSSLHDSVSSLRRRQRSQTFTFTVPGSYELIVPSWSKGYGRAEIFGGGGGGAAGIYGSQAGVGGGGAATIITDIVAKPHSTLTIVVGSGGAGGSGGAVIATGINAGGNGTASSISGLIGPDPILVAGGGFGGPGLSSSSSSSLPALGTGGAPSPASFPSEFGQGQVGLAYNGQNGGTISFEDILGGAGGAASFGGVGGHPGYYQDAAGQVSAGGNGVPPGGGGGGGSEDVTGGNGGTGANGAVIITF